MSKIEKHLKKEIFGAEGFFIANIKKKRPE
jgi:hypothetical protein